VLTNDPHNRQAAKLLGEILSSVFPPPYSNRVSKTSLVSEGGSAETEAAVAAALEWLKRHQHKDGSWDQDGYHKKCDPDEKERTCGKCDSGQYDVGVTSLALLAFMGAGNTRRYGKYKETVKRGLDWIVKQQKEDGSISTGKAESWIYNHAIATLALCEAFALTKNYRIGGSAQKAVDFIRKAQNPKLGWKYKPRGGENDSSVTGWMVLVLKAAEAAKLNVDKRTFQGAMTWFDMMTNNAGKCGYMKRGDDGYRIVTVAQKWGKLPVMTGVSVLCRILCGQEKKEAKIRKGMELLMANLPEWKKPKCDKVDMYYWFWAAQAVFQYGGKKWQKWNDALKKALVDTQKKEGCAKGSWDPVGKWGAVGGRVYSTALGALILETYYRHQRVQPKAKENK
jgi:prenyltransferase beta subunit